MRTVTRLLIASLLLAAGFVAALLWHATPEAEASIAVRDDFIALTARDRSGVEFLYVIDPRQHMLLAYEMKSDGLAIVATRKLDYDFKVVSYRDASKKGLRFEDLKERFTQPQKQGARPK